MKHISEILPIVLKEIQGVNRPSTDKKVDVQSDNIQTSTAVLSSRI